VSLSPQAPIIVAPFANERIREWPPEHFRGLTSLILQTDAAAKVAVVGTRQQRTRANDIIREFPATRVINTCGDLSWSDLLGAIDEAPYVVANNSGVAHLAAERKKWTLCLFAGSHSYVEWAPRGPRVVVCMLDVACSPCGIGGEKCPNNAICMVGMTPHMVFDKFQRVLNEGNSSGTAFRS
jgi:ADP-heptose:LPS heptosyltransferase